MVFCQTAKLIYSNLFILTHQKKKKNLESVAFSLQGTSTKISTRLVYESTGSNGFKESMPFMRSYSQRNTRVQRGRNKVYGEETNVRQPDKEEELWRRESTKKPKEENGDRRSLICERRSPRCLAEQTHKQTVLGMNHHAERKQVNEC